MTRLEGDCELIVLPAGGAEWNIQEMQISGHRPQVWVFANVPEVDDDDGDGGDVGGDD